MGAGPVKISTSATSEREHEQCTWRPRALSLSNRAKTVTLASSYVWITLLFDHVVMHFQFVWQWKTHPFLQNLKQHCQKCWPPGWLSVKMTRGSERVNNLRCAGLLCCSHQGNLPICYLSVADWSAGKKETNRGACSVSKIEGGRGFGA